MSEIHLYLSLIPQALIASMLPPAEFGRYYSVGTRQHGHGDAIFFELDPSFRSDDFPFEIISRKCVPGSRGEPKESVYLAIYRVLSRVPVAALGNLYLVTGHGLTLELQAADYVAPAAEKLHLYQEFCPLTPLVVSRLEPLAFSRFITDPAQPVHVPRIVFSQLQLRTLAHDPVAGAGDDLPYEDIDHLRDCLQDIAGGAKHSKLVHRQPGDHILYRMLEDGFYVGDQYDFAFYRFPSPEIMESQHRNWWRSAQQPLSLRGLV